MGASCALIAHKESSMVQPESRQGGNVSFMIGFIGNALIGFVRRLALDLGFAMLIALMIPVFMAIAVAVFFYAVVAAIFLSLPDDNRSLVVTSDLPDSR